MKADDGKKGYAAPSGRTPSAGPSGQQAKPKNLFNPRARLDPGQMEVRPPGHPGHKRGTTPK